MDLEEITLDDALRLLTIPRVVGVIDGEEVVAHNGKFGPYIKKGTDSRSLTTEEELLTITIEQAKEVFAQPKQRGRRAAAAPLRELGDDPGSKKPVVVKEGRFGPYVTDGETNASLRKGDTVEEITIERAAELLAERREKAPVKKAPGQEGPGEEDHGHRRQGQDGGGEVDHGQADGSGQHEGEVAVYNLSACAVRRAG